MTNNPKNRNKLIGIQAGRGLAAILVVFYHGGRMLPQYIGPTEISSLFHFGSAGVDFFFVLSGFIIYFVHSVDIDHPNRLGHYLWRRITRIYPIYWVVTGLVIAILFAKRDWAGLAPAHVINSLLLIPQQDGPIVGVGWTLSHEMLFYLVFATLILSRTLGWIVGLLWVGVVGLESFVYPGNPYLGFLGSPYHLEFAFGIMAAFAAKRWPVSASWLFVAVGTVLFLFVGWRIHDETIRNMVLGRVLYGSLSALIIYGLAVWEGSGRVAFPRWCAFLGAASYSIYLIHTSPLGWFGKLAARSVPSGLAVDAQCVAIVVASIAVGCALYQFVERPLQNLVRKLRFSGA